MTKKSVSRMEVCQVSLPERHDTTRRPDTRRFELEINNTVPLPNCSSCEPAAAIELQHPPSYQSITTSSECENVFKAITLRHRSPRSSNNRGNATKLQNLPSCRFMKGLSFASLGLKLMKRQSKARNTTKTRRQISLDHAFPLWDRSGAGEPWDLSRMSNFNITWRQGGRLEESLKLLGLCPISNGLQPMALLKATTKTCGMLDENSGGTIRLEPDMGDRYIFRNFRSLAVI
ncbi:hypothetical protein ACO22_05730 [Paracoccidioides brasiliensis]|uniref:Uncharacterized protein n=1 Tax=Paracoccidioides brasiliensis TaxID=121759 RepID=A0A1D2J9Q1_PARBR|nr:hypothetical protein ACO22_05730 [Paracoccidioides brasiliensis]